MPSCPWSDGAARRALAFLFLALPSCVVVPVPEYATTELGRAELAGRLDEAVRPGEPVEDLLLRLGEPDAVSLDGRELAYRWQRVWAWFLALVPIGGGAVPAPALLPLAGPLETERFLLVRLEDDCVGDVRVLVTRGRAATLLLPDRSRWAALALFSPSSFRGEPIELFAGASWSPPGRPSPIDALVVMTPSGVYLKALESFGPAPADLSLRFAAMAGARLDRGPLGVGASLVLEMQEGFVHALQIRERGEPPSVEATERAYRIVAAHRGERAVAPTR